jgi:hypothetical protein
MHSDPNGIVVVSLVDVDYTAVTEFRDRNLLYAFGRDTIINENELLQIYITSDLAAVVAQTIFQVSALRIAETISI